MLALRFHEFKLIGFIGSYIGDTVDPTPYWGKGRSYEIGRRNFGGPGSFKLVVVGRRLQNGD